MQSLALNAAIIAPSASKVDARRMISVRSTPDEERTIQAKAEVQAAVEQVTEPVQRVSAEASSSLGQQVKSTLNPRVNQLRNNQLSSGLTNPADIWSFFGPLPELLNGRLAMLGVVACMGSELVSHVPLTQQLSIAPTSILAISAVIAVASLIPIVRGTKILDNGTGEGLFQIGAFNVTNELVNARAAMLGFAIICIYETAAGAPLFQ